MRGLTKIGSKGMSEGMSEGMSGSMSGSMPIVFKWHEERQELRTSKKKVAFKLFSEGKVASSPEVKALKLYESNRYKYFSEWQKLGKPAEPETHQSQPALVSSKSSSGETKAKPKNDQGEKPKPLETLSQEEAKGKDGAQSPILTF